MSGGRFFNTQARQQLLQRWLNKRLPAANHITLNHHSIFILPTFQGLLWVIMVLLLYLFGTNYQNNLIIGLGILMLGLFVTSILLCYRNLAGIDLSARPIGEVYQGNTLGIAIGLSARQTSYHLQLSYHNKQSVTLAQLTTDSQDVYVPFNAVRRGFIEPPRLTLVSAFPLGLCRAWTYVNLANPLWVFAAPIASTLLSAQFTPDNQTGKGAPQTGADEFIGLKNYVVGDALNRVAWKQWAQKNTMQVKQFHQPQGLPQWLILPEVYGAARELAISQLTFKVNELIAQGISVGLALPRQRLPPDDSEAHRLRCLQALAALPLATETSAEAATRLKDNGRHE